MLGNRTRAKHQQTLSTVHLMSGLPPKKTCAAHKPMSAKCQKGTLRLLDNLVGCGNNDVPLLLREKRCNGGSGGTATDDEHIAF